MIEIERPKIEIAEISENGTYGKFVVEPLERGFGTTLGTVCGGCCSPVCRALP